VIPDDGSEVPFEVLIVSVLIPVLLGSQKVGAVIEESHEKVSEAELVHVMREQGLEVAVQIL
jgi:hypothetical protein